MKVIHIFFMKMKMIQLKPSFVFLWCKKTTADENIYSISNIKYQIIFSKKSVVGSHEYELCYCSCTYNEHNGFSMEIFQVDMGLGLQSSDINIFLIK